MADTAQTLDLPPLARAAHAAHCNRCLSGTSLTLSSISGSPRNQVFRVLKRMLTRLGWPLFRALHHPSLIVIAD